MYSKIAEEEDNKMAAERWQRDASRDFLPHCR